MKTNTDCTVYNLYRNEAAGEIEVHKTHLSAVFWVPHSGAEVTSHGVADGGSLRVYIPLAVDAGGKEYLDPVQYAGQWPEQVQGYWTLTPGTDYLVKGAGREITTPKELKESLATFYDSFKIFSVDTKMYGSGRLRHWEVRGK